jgi:hypothetical protein
MHACAPVMNVNKLPKTPGMALAASGIASQRSGLQTDKHSLEKEREKAEYGTGARTRACTIIPWTKEGIKAYLNSSASSPHNDFSLWMSRIGMTIMSPSRTLF